MEYLVIGSGGHAKVLIDAFCQIKGVIQENKIVSEFCGLPILGDDSFLNKIPKNKLWEYRLVNGVGSVKDTTAKEKVFLKFPQFQFAHLISVQASVSSFASLGDGIQVLPFAIIQRDATIGVNCTINTGAIVSHDCVIGNHCHIAPNATLSGNVQIGDGCHIGASSVIIQGIKIGHHCTIGAGSTVIHDVPDNSIVAGSPTRLIYTKE